MMWLFLVIAALIITWLATSAVRKQKRLDRASYPGGVDPQRGKEVGRQ